MDYELAKQLKDAGFPQDPTLNGKGYWHGVDDCYVPTLEELIEACGDGFDGLMNQKRGWVAMMDRYKSLEECFFGSTPTEAVARLWLALNKKV